MSEEPKSGEVTIIIDRWLSLRAAGKDASIEELCQDTPHLVESVKLELEALAKMDRLLNNTDAEIAGKTQPEQSVEQATIPNVSGIRQGSEEAIAKLRVERLYGRGGTSDVYLAFDETLRRPIAAKFLRPEHRSNELFRQRLQREAEIASRLDHPGVVSIHWIGSESDGSPFYSMQFVAGKTLGEAIQELHKEDTGQRKHTWRSKSEFVQQARKLLNHFVDVCQTIAYAHQQRVLHRDIKPANVVIGNFGETFVVDWGLAKWMDEETTRGMDDQKQKPMNLSAELTSAGGSLGTPAFMSPQQARGEKQDTVAFDVFNLGATLYNVLAGRPPYGGESLIEVLNAAESGNYDPVNRINRYVPQPLLSICQKAMSLDPAQRYRSAKGLADDVDRFLADQPVSAFREPWTDRARRWIAKNRTTVTTIATSVLVALVLLLIGNALLIGLNRQLSIRESEAIQLQQQTQNALEQATESLYSQRISLAHSELTKNNYKRADAILNECPKESRRWEWRLLRWMVDRHQPFAVLNTVGPQTKGLAFTRDGSHVAAGSSNGTIQVWKVDQWKQVKEVNSRIRIVSIAWSLDAEFIYASGIYRNHAVIRRVNVQSGEIAASRSGTASSINCVVVSPDGQHVITAESDGQIKIRDPVSLEPRVRIRRDSHTDQVNSIAFADDSKSFYSCGSDGKIFCWDLQGNRLESLPAHSTALNEIHCFKDRLVFASASGQLGILQLKKNGENEKSWRLKTTTAAHFDHVLSVDIAESRGIVATGGMDRNVRLLDLATGEILETIQQHTSHVQRVRFDDSGRFLLTAGDDKIVQVWDCEKLAAKIPRGRFIAYCPIGDVNQIVIADGRVAYLWDQYQGRLIRRITDHPAEITGVVGCNEGRFATLYLDGTVRVWNAGNGRLLHQFGNQSQRAAYSGKFLTGSNQLVVGFQRGSVGCYDLDDGSVAWKIDSSFIPFRIEVGNLERRLYVGSPSGQLECWDIKTKSLVNKINAHSQVILQLQIHPDNQRVASAGGDGQIKIWDADLNQALTTMKSGDTWLNCITFVPDGSRMLSGNEHTLTCWDTTTGDEVISLALDRCVHLMCINQDGTEIALASDRRPTDPKDARLPPVRIFKAPLEH